MKARFSKDSTAVVSDDQTAEGDCMVWIVVRENGKRATVKASETLVDEDSGVIILGMRRAIFESGAPGRRKKIQHYEEA